MLTGARILAGVEHIYKVHYRRGTTGTAGVMIVPTAAKAEEEKRRLERDGYVVTAILPPKEDEPAPTIH